MPASPTRFEPPGIDPTRAPAAMTRDQRRQEIAAILARGVLRLRRNARNGPVSCPDCPPPKNSRNSVGKPLRWGRGRAFM